MEGEKDEESGKGEEREGDRRERERGKEKGVRSGGGSGEEISSGLK